MIANSRWHYMASRRPSDPCHVLLPSLPRARSSWRRSRTGRGLAEGSLPLPLGDRTHEGQPASHPKPPSPLESPPATPRGGVTTFGECRARGVAVVHEHRRPSGVRVQRHGNRADVPAVARREQRQQGYVGEESVHEADRGLDAQTLTDIRDELLPVEVLSREEVGSPSRDSCRAFRRANDQEPRSG
jgi:hypothetical protein